MAELSAASLQRSNDALAMLQLFHRIVDTVVVHSNTNGGSRRLLTHFVTVDRRHTARDVMVLEVSALLSYVRPIFPPQMLTDQELLLLFVTLSLWDGQDKTTRVDVVDFFCALRQLLPFQAWQVHEAVCRGRSILAQNSGERANSRSNVMADAQSCGLKEMLYDYLQGYRVTSASALHDLHESVHPVLVRDCGLSYSEADQLLRYVAGHVQGRSETEAQVSACAAMLLELLFVPHPASLRSAVAAMYLARFAESTLVPADDSSNGGASVTGSLALLAALRYVTGHAGKPPDSNDIEQSVGSSLEADFGASLLQCTLDESMFAHLCVRLRVDLSREEQRTLYDMLSHSVMLRSVDEGQYNVVPSDRSTGKKSLLRVFDLVCAFRHAFPQVTRSLLQIIASATREALLQGATAATDFLVFTRLYDSLEEYDTLGCVPLERYVNCLRTCGVAASGPRRLRDIELEWLRLWAPTRRALLSLLCLPLAPSREAIVRKVYESIVHRNAHNEAEGSTNDTAGATVTAAQVVQAFVPARLEAMRGGPNARDLARVALSWKEALVHYLVATTQNKHVSQDDEDNSSEADRVTNGVVSYERFAFFFALLSAGVRDDPTFTMLLWQSFDLSHRVYHS